MSTTRPRDGTLDSKDCAPGDPAIHPGAADLPDLAFVDSDCDGIDGGETKAVFASPLGSDANPGTKAKPKRTIAAAVVAAAGTGRYVVAAAGGYTGVDRSHGRRHLRRIRPEHLAAEHEPGDGDRWLRHRACSPTTRRT